MKKQLLVGKVLALAFSISLGFSPTAFGGATALRPSQAPGSNITITPSGSTVPGNIVDMHTHVGCLDPEYRPDFENKEGPGANCYVSEKMKRSIKYSVYLRSFGATDEEMNNENLHRDALFDRSVETLAQRLRESKYVKRSVILGLDGYVTSTGDFDWEKTAFYVPNSYLLAKIREPRYQGLFYYGPSINPNRRNALELLDQAIIDGAVLIKWIPSTMNIKMGDAHIDAFYEKMAAHGIPLLVHTGKEKTFLDEDTDDEKCDPVLLAAPLLKGVNVIAAHAASSGYNQGGCCTGEASCMRLDRLFKDPRFKYNPKYEDPKYRTNPMLMNDPEYREYKRYGKLFADISAGTQFNRISSTLNTLRNPDYQGRLLYGSDWPLTEVKFFGVGLTWVPLYKFLNLFPFIRLFTGPAAALEEYNRSTSVFDKDVLLKRAMGTDLSVFLFADQVLHL